MEACLPPCRPIFDAHRGADLLGLGIGALSLGIGHYALVSERTVANLYPCPCCGFMVHHDEPGTFEFCPVCGWQDDLSQLRFPTMGGGANAVSLVDAQQRFLARGSVGPQVRERDHEWRPLDPTKDYVEVSIVGTDYGSTYAWDRTAYYYWRRGLDHVYLPDSWVVAVESDETRVCFTIEAALEEAHPRFYWPPRSGEVYAYALLTWCIYGEVHWNEGPFEPKATDATGARDYGTIDAWWSEGGTEHVSGEFGDVVIRQARSSFTYLDR